MTRSTLILLLLIALPIAAWTAESKTRAVEASTVVAQAMEATRQDVKQSARELADTRDRIAESRVPLATELAAVESRVVKLRDRARQLRTARQQGEQTHTALKQDVQALHDDARFVLALLSEYRRSLETRANPAESVLLEPDFTLVDPALTEKDEYAQLPNAAAHLLALAAKWNGLRLGGCAFDGSCLDANGVEHPGRFAIFGPTAYFSTPSADVAGLVMMRLDSSRPAVFPGSSDDRRAAIRDLTTGRPATVPMDVTAGDALKVEASRETWPEHIRKGGLVMVPILAVALLALVLTVIKFVTLRRLRVRESFDITRILELVRKGDMEGAAAAARAVAEPMATIIRDGLTHRQAPKEHIEEILHEHLLGHIPVLERHLGTLAVLGGIAPLLGLLGTVTGMIHTFKLATIFGTGNAKVLSGGISEALITTEYGLYIAIPVLLVHAAFSRRVRSIIGAMERAMVLFVNELAINRRPL